MKKIIFGTVIGLILVGVCVYFTMYFSYNNQHKDYHTRYDAEMSVVEGRLDNMWKIISDKFDMSQQYADDFKEIAKVNIGAFNQGGEMWKWINTQLPQIDPTIYKEVMATIESERLSFENAQKKIIDIVREHNNLIVKVPSSWFISDKTLLEWKVISSKETKEIMESREDNRTLSIKRNG